MRPFGTALAALALALTTPPARAQEMDFGGEEAASPAAEVSAAASAPAFVPPPPIWVVQRAYVLRARRFELIPRFGFSLNDQFVSHYGFGGQLNWYITEVLAIGIEGQWFFWNPESDTNYFTSRSFRVSVPINEYWMGFYLNFQYVPMYGKFAMFMKSHHCLMDRLRQNQFFI